MVEFCEINLIKPWPFDSAQGRPGLSGMHLILMRNVLIYLDVETRRAILDRAGRLLDPEGYLLLGGSETTTTLDGSFDPVTLDGAVCFQRRGAAAAAVVQRSR